MGRPALGKGICAVRIARVLAARLDWPWLAGMPASVRRA